MVLPEKEEIRMEDPVLIHQSGKFGVKLKAYSPSVHMIRANIETEIAPIVGSEEQAKDLIQYIQEGRKQEDRLYEGQREQGRKRDLGDKYFRKIHRRTGNGWNAE